MRYLVTVYDEFDLRFVFTISLVIFLLNCDLIFEGEELSFISDTNTDLDANTDLKDDAHSHADAIKNFDNVGRIKISDGIRDPNNASALIDSSTSFEASTDKEIDASETDQRDSSKLDVATEMKDANADSGDVLDDLCGDGFVEDDEVCDDGNNQDGDGCSGTCDKIEPGAICVESKNNTSVCRNCVILVNKNVKFSNETGQTWDNSYIELSTALQIAPILLNLEQCNSVEVWVAAGTYKPTNRQNRSVSFMLHNNVAIYGGFAGNEISRNQRDWRNRETILSGNISNNEEDDPKTIEGSYHVVVGREIDRSAVLDGFRITWGCADIDVNQDSTDDSGGGIYNERSSPTLSNLVIANNYASYEGGGIFNLDNSNPNISNVTFTNNYAFFGGGLANRSNSNPVITSALFDRNIVKRDGAGINNWADSTVRLNHATFIRNQADWFGGGVHTANPNPNYDYYSRISTYRDVSFVQNKAQTGGGVYAGPYSRDLFSNVIFRQNQAWYGGGMSVYYYSNIMMDHVWFIGNRGENPNNDSYCGGGIYSELSSLVLVDAFLFSNTTNKSGGGICISHSDLKLGNSQSDMTLANVALSGNIASEYGGGIAAFAFSGKTITTTLSNVTMAGNYSELEGEAIYSNSIESQFHLTNTILWNNGDEIAGPGPVTVQYSAVEGGSEGIGNTSEDVQFRRHFPLGEYSWSSVTYHSSTDLTALIDSNASWTEDELKGLLVRLRAGSDGSHLWALIESNTESEILVLGDLTDYVAENDIYEVVDLHLSAQSPCIDAGNDLYAPFVDLDGRGRYDSPAIPNCTDSGVAECDWISDIGVFEYDSTDADMDPLCGIPSQMDENGHDYYHCSKANFSWVAAVQYCDLLGADLVEIQDTLENDYVSSFISDKSWIGAINSATPANWVWSNGEKVDVTFGSPLNPDSSGYPSCIAISNPDVGWSAEPCLEKRRFVCESTY